jgi:hypothetical protein
VRKAGSIIMVALGLGKERIQHRIVAREVTMGVEEETMT